MVHWRPAVIAESRWRRRRGVYLSGLRWEGISTAHLAKERHQHQSQHRTKTSSSNTNDQGIILRYFYALAGRKKMAPSCQGGVLRRAMGK